MADILATFPLKKQPDAAEPPPPARWQAALKSAYTRVPELLAALDLSLADLDQRVQAQADFPVRVPRSFVARMRKGDVNDPLLLQVLPAADELQTLPGFVADPLQEQQGPLPGVLHKYRSRVLLVATGACAVNCRYCFRRHFPYEDHRAGRQSLTALLDYLRAHPGVNEVIFSGGDPLSLPDAALAEQVTALAELPQITRVRVHTRLPVVIPERVTPELVQALAGTRLRPVMVLHINHGREVNDDVVAALAPLRAAGVTLLNQAVLLRGVNDSEDALVALQEAVFAAGILPYYLFLLDRVQGAHHFEVPEAEAVALMRAVQARLPGFLLPRLAREIAGQPAKTLIDLQDASTTG